MTELEDNQEQVAGDETQESPDDEMLSHAARLAASILESAGAYSVLCPGCGGGRTSAYLATRGFRVTAYDISETAVQGLKALALRLGVDIDAFVDDLVMPSRRLEHFDGIFSDALLNHLMLAQRQRLLRTFYRSMRQGGVLIVSVMSIEDSRYGYGRVLEEDTFESPLGEAIHFYTAPELHDELSRFFQVTSVEDMEEVSEQGGLGRQSYRVLVATARRVD